MNATTLREAAARHKLALLLALVTAVAAVVFRRPLIAWFTGQPMSAGASSAATSSQAGPFAIEASIEPDPPGQKGNTLHLAIAGPDRAAVAGARVKVAYVMPPMGGMAEMRGAAEVADGGGGHYAA